MVEGREVPTGGVTEFKNQALEEATDGVPAVREGIPEKMYEQHVFGYIACTTFLNSIPVFPRV